MLKKYRRYKAEILPIRCKTQYNQSINQSEKNHGTLKISCTIYYVLTMKTITKKN